MKLIKYSFRLGVIASLMISFFQCSGVPKLEKKAPVTVENVYCQKWNAGVQQGGSGLDIFLEVKSATVQFDSIYFRGKATKLHINPRKISVYVGRFKSETNTAMDVKSESLISSPFNMKEDQCIVSYLKNDKVFYFKIDNVTERPLINYPSAPPKGN